MKWKQKLEGGSHKLKNAKEPPEAGTREIFSSQAVALLTPCFQISSLQYSKKISFLLFKATQSGNLLWQPQKTDATLIIHSFIFFIV